MKVILLENLAKIGSIGEIIDVKRGFARNYLISNKKALYASKENIKDNVLKIFIFYCVLSFIFLSLLNVTGVRLFNSLNLTMTLVSGGGFLPSDNLSDIISTNFQKIILIFSLILSMLNFYFIFNIFSKKKLIFNHKEDFYLIGISFIYLGAA